MNSEILDYKTFLGKQGSIIELWYKSITPVQGKHLNIFKIVQWWWQLLKGCKKCPACWLWRCAKQSSQGYQKIAALSSPWWGRHGRAKEKSNTATNLDFSQALLNTPIALGQLGQKIMCKHLFQRHRDKTQPSILAAHSQQCESFALF